MKPLVVALCILLGAAIGTLVAGAWTRRDPPELARATQLRGEIASLRSRFADVERELAAVATPAAATAARAKLFQLRVDMTAIQDELAALSRPTPVAR